MLRPCLDCGEPSEESRCPAHGSERQVVRDARRGSFRARGYDGAWRRLSREARRLQPWCSDCGARDDLSVDHLPGAWEKRARGERLTLDDVAVVCISCNSRRGPRRAEVP